MISKAMLAKGGAPSKFRNFIKPNADAEFPAEKGRYHLYISLACPWASRCLATLNIKGLNDIIGLSVVHPVFQRTRPDDENDKHTGWTFVDPVKTPTLPGPTGLGAYSSEGAIPDTINKAQYVRDLYEMCSTDNARYSVPLLWDKVKKTIVSNESGDIVRMLTSAFDAFVPSKTDLYPEALREQIDEINEWMYEDINHGVYKCGFAPDQEVYDAAVTKVFASLGRMEEILSRQRFVVGNQLTESDVRLFVTLIRFDEVYHVHFKANKKMIKDYPNLSNYVRDLYQYEPIRRSVNFQHFRLHYYASHTHINTFGIVPIGPGIDYNAPHDRARFGDAEFPPLPQNIQW